MQCPKCGHEPTLSEVQSSPNDCTQCGINFEGYARSQQALREQVPIGMKASPEVKAVVSRFPGAQPVVVIDVDMKFWSMVRFMVKWAFASIPALLIIFAIGVALSAVWSALLGFPGMGKVPAVNVPGASSGEPASGTYMDLPSEPEVAYFLMKLQKSGDGTVSMEVKRNAPSGLTYQALSIDCATRTISVDANSPTYAEMVSAHAVGTKVRPPVGSTRDFFISRACR